MKIRTPWIPVPYGSGIQIYKYDYILDLIIPDSDECCVSVKGPCPTSPTKQLEGKCTIGKEERKENQITFRTSNVLIQTFSFMLNLRSIFEALNEFEQKSCGIKSS